MKGSMDVNIDGACEMKQWKERWMCKRSIKEQSMECWIYVSNGLETNGRIDGSGASDESGNNRISEG